MDMLETDRPGRRARTVTATLVPLLLGLAAPARGQDAPARTYRLLQGGAELGREWFRIAGGRVERTALIPMLNLRLVSRSEFDADGRFARFVMEASNAAGDTSHGTWTLDALADSLVGTNRPTGGAERRAALPGRADGVLPPQSLTVTAEAVWRAAGRDTTLRYLPAGGNALIDVRVQHGGDTVFVTTGGVTALVVRSTGVISVPVQRVTALPWNGVDSLPPLAGLRRPARNYAAPAGAAYTATDVRIPIRTASGDTLTLAGTLTLPAGASGAVPVAITISGSGSQERDSELWPLLTDYRPFRQIAERLARDGIGVLRYDDRGVGGSTGVPGTTEELAHDVGQLVAWLRTQPGVDGRRIAVVGHSEGGSIGPLVAAADPTLAAVVIMAGVGKPGRAVLADQLRRPIEQAVGLPAAERAAQLAAVEEQLNAWEAASAWNRYFARFEPLAVVRRVRQPVLIQHGALDRQVTVGQADTLAAALRAGGNRNVTVRIYPRLNHLFLPSEGDGSPTEYAGLRQQSLPAEVLDDLAAWLGRHLGRAR